VGAARLVPRRSGRKAMKVNANTAPSSRPKTPTKTVIQLRQNANQIASAVIVKRSRRQEPSVGSSGS
jgi:hypothetical protein